MSTDPGVVEPGRMQGEDAPPAANQAKTEPIPPTQGHDVATPDEHHPDEEAGTSTGPGPRMGAGAGARPADAPGVSPEGRDPGLTRPTASGAPDTATGPHDPGRVESDLPGAASRVPGVQGASPEPFEADTAAGAERMAAAGQGADASGDVHDVNVPSATPAEGTSEALEPVDGVRVTSIAPDGHADGEYDNRMPPTTSF